MKTEELLAQEDFVRRLARRLVSDEHGISDITQQAWLAALEHPPSSKGVLRSWLSKVTRNLAITRLRSDARRIERERAAAVPEGIPSSEEFAALEEVRREVVQAIYKLDDLHRTVIFLRFYQELPWIEIAQRVGVPIETARSRLKRALAKLREKLDKKFGDRDSWCLALAPLVGLKVGAIAAGAAASTVSTVSGGLIMAMKVKIGIAAVVVLGAAFMVWQSSQVENGDGQVPLTSTTEELSRNGLDLSPLNIEGADDEKRLDEEGLDREVIEPIGLLISGRVTDMATRKPVTSYSFELWPTPEKGKPRATRSEMIYEIVEDREGRFSFPMKRGGKFNLRIRSPVYVQRIDQIQISETKGLADLQIRLDPGLSVVGRVVDAETKKPIPDAFVIQGSPKSTGLYDRLCVRQKQQYLPFAKTDSQGRFHLQGLKRINKPVSAAHIDYVEGCVDAIPGEPSDVIVELERGFRIFGTVRDDRGMAVEGIIITVDGPSIPHHGSVLTGVDGTYQSRPVLPGHITLSAAAQQGKSPETAFFTPETKVVEVVDRDVRLDLGPTSDLVTWVGTVYDYDGIPVPHLKIEMLPKEIFQEGKRITEGVILRRSLNFQCDEEGHFEIGKLYVGRYSVKLDFPGRANRVDWGEVRLEEPGVIEKDIHITGSVISGVIVDGSSGEPLTGCSGYMSMKGYDPSDGSRRRHEAIINKNSRFKFRGLLPGEYVVEARMEGRPTVRVPTPFVGKNEVIEDFKVVIPVGGTLLLKMINKGKSTPNQFRLSIVRPEEMRRGRKYEFDAKGIFEHKAELEVGRWKMVFCFPGVGLAEREFMIASGRETEVLINCQDFTIFEGTINVRGEIVDFDGSPVSDAKIEFRGDQDSVPSLRGSDICIEAETDAEGRFEVGGFKPGAWGISVRLPPSMRIYFPEVWIPAHPVNPFPFRLSIPQGGVVRGYLVEEETGLNLKKDQDWRGSCRLIVVSGRGRSCQGDVQKEGSIELVRVPEGAYRLRVNAVGYRMFHSELFELADGQVLDLGAIPVIAAGRIDLEVLNQNEQFVSDIYVRLENDQGFFRETGAGGRCPLTDLPLGTMKVKVSADGYRPQERTVVLKPGMVENVRIKMESE